MGMFRERRHLAGEFLDYRPRHTPARCRRSRRTAIFHSALRTPHSAFPMILALVILPLLAGLAAFALPSSAMRRGLLVGTAAAGSTFAGWSKAGCSGPG